jgi:hypothetical protein
MGIPVVNTDAVNTTIIEELFNMPAAGLRK